MPEVTIRPRQPADDQCIVDIDNGVNPDLPRETVEIFRHRMEHRPEGVRDERYVAELDGEIVADSGLIQMWWLESSEAFISWIAVQRDRWGQGIGSRLYDHLLPRAKEIQAKKLYVWIRDGEQHVLDFVLHRGYTLTPRSHRLSRLNVHTANLEGFEGVEERLRREGIDICTVADVGVENEEFLRRLHAMSDETIRDVPSSEQFGDTPFELFLEDLRAPGNSPEWMWVAMDGERPVGLAFLRVMDGSALNEYTATDRAYRGRGIARALKLKTIEWCRANGIESIYTGNDIDNQRMLAINIRLGYEMLPPFREVVKELS